MLKLFMTLTFLFAAATLVQAEVFLPLPDTMSIMGIGEITPDDLGDASAWTVNTVCRNVNGKIYCYDSDTDTSTVCRTVNGALVCD